MRVSIVRQGLLAADAIQRLVAGRNSTTASLPENPARILIWSMDRIGDVQRATPLFRLLKQRYPSAAITAVVAGRAAPILENNPYIAAIQTVTSPYDAGAHVRVLRSLASTSWDLALLPEVDRAWAKLGEWSFRLLRVENWVTFDLGNIVPRRAVAVALNPDGSWTDQFIAMAAAAGAVNDGQGLDLCVAEHERAWARDFLTVQGVGPDQCFFLVHPGGGDQVVSRHWRPERYGALIDGLSRRWGWPVIVTGSAPDRPVVAAVREHCPTSFRDLCGRLDLRQLAAVIAQSTVCVMNDTGPLHMAHALRKPTVAILGPTAPQTVGIPDSTTAVYADLPCRPCAFLKDWTACTNPQQFACLANLLPDRVLAAVADLITKLDAEPLVPRHMRELNKVSAQRISSRDPGANFRHER